MYKAGPRGVTLVNSFGWRSADFENNVAAALNEEVGDGSVYILNDAVEQHYRKEKINKLTALDRKNIIDRRLNIAFPSYPTRAALPLKEKKGKGLPLSKEHLFLFAAVPSTDSFRKLLEAIRRADCTVADYCLLPIESVDLVEKIAAKVAKENRQLERSGWSILLGQHQGGGLRQIVIKGGQIALTRITPVVMPEAQNAAQWASDVVQELQSTISYLSRFGYAQNDGLDIILISKPDFGALVEDMINIPCQFSSLTLQRAAEFAGVTVGRKQDQHYADPLHIAWRAKKPRNVMAMQSKEIDAVANPRKVAFFAMLLLTAGIGYFAFTVASEALTLYGDKQNLVEVNKMKVLADQMYDDEIKRKESLGIDVKLIQGSLAIYKDIDKITFDPLPVLEIAGQELKDLRMDGVTLKADMPEPPKPDPNNPSAEPVPLTRQAAVTLKFSFPGTIKPEDGNEKIEQLRKRIAKKLPGYKVDVSKQLADLTYTGQLTNETGFTAVKRRAEEVYTGEILIQKDISDVSGSGT